MKQTRGVGIQTILRSCKITTQTSWFAILNNKSYSYILLVNYLEFAFWITVFLTEYCCRKDDFRWNLVSVASFFSTRIQFSIVVPVCFWDHVYFSSSKNLKLYNLIAFCANSIFLLLIGKQSFIDLRPQQVEVERQLTLVQPFVK